MALTRHLSKEQLADHKKLRGLASVIANDVCRRINKEAVELDTPTMPYKTQYVLEELIQILEARV